MKLFVRNLPLDVTSDQLLKAFEEHAWVDSVEIIKNGQTGESLGCGFVVMSTSSDGQKAIEGLNGKELFGRTIEVTENRRDRSERREFKERRSPEPRRKLADRRAEHIDRRDVENRRHDQ